MLLQGVWLKYNGNHRLVMAPGLVCNFHYTFARLLVTTHFLTSDFQSRCKNFGNLFGRICSSNKWRNRRFNIVISELSIKAHSQIYCNRMLSRIQPTLNEDAIIQKKHALTKPKPSSYHVTDVFFYNYAFFRV